MTVISLQDVRSARERPDPELIAHGPDGTEYRSFLVEYEHDGAVYGFHLFAIDWQDAENRVRSIAAVGRVIGEIHIVDG